MISRSENKSLLCLIDLTTIQETGQLESTNNDLHTFLGQFLFTRIFDQKLIPQLFEVD